MAQGANDVRAGGAWYELYGKDKLSAVLEGARKKAESVGGAIKSVGKKAGAGALEMLGGLKGKLIEIGAELGAGAVKAIAGISKNLEHLQKEYEKTARLIAQADKLMDTNLSRRGERIEAELDPSKRKALIDAEIKQLERERADELGRKNQFQEEKDRLGIFKEKATGSDRMKALGLWLAGGEEEAIGAIQHRLDAAYATSDKLWDRIQELNDQRSRILNPDNDPQKKKAVAELNRELQKQTDILGKSADQIKAYEMRLEGFSQKQIDVATAAMKTAELRKNTFEVGSGILDGVLGLGPEVRDQIRETTAELKKQADLWNATADQITLYELRAKGATEAALNGVKEQLERTKLLNMFGGAAEAIASGVAATERATLASMGSFSGMNASQVFAGDTISVKQLKAAELTAKNTEATVKGIDRLAMGLRFK
ncbi:hypothetical protein R5W24_004442 [Gemmata sp. JC717]|uniref:hypothetical protein n=1 Tax=Gemmata algarum TaxID=2975278 RepID=UPI0021BA48C8|nr:hypothetical protein [Gemmata algarum]MDY3555301.1 hypothetical protein [Gemmata algarum]